MTTTTRKGWHFVPGHDANPKGAVRRMLVSTLAAAGLYERLPVRLANFLCRCELCRGEQSS